MSEPGGLAEGTLISHLLELRANAPTAKPTTSVTSIAAIPTDSEMRPANMSRLMGTARLPARKR